VIRFPYSDLNRRHEVSPIVLQSGCLWWGSLDAGLARSTYPKAAKPQIHKATKREKRHPTSDPGPRVQLLDQSLREVAIASLH
jgi:hypothetical protein